jgi:hypothetical protein
VGAPAPSFAAQQTFAAGYSPISLSLGDVNGDGKPDLAVTNLVSSNVSVFLNTTPTPLFVTRGTAIGTILDDDAPTFLSVSDPVPVSEGDSGTTSLVFVVTRSGDTSRAQVVRYTTADGSAHAGVDYMAASGILSFAAGQASATVTVAVFDNTVLQANRSLSLILTAQTGPVASFTPEQTYDTGGFPNSVALGDVNGDGKLDVVFTSFNAKSVSVFLNTTGVGAMAPSFAEQQTFATGLRPGSMTLGDVNGDGKPDIVIGNKSGSFIFLQNGNHASGGGAQK